MISLILLWASVFVDTKIIRRHCDADVNVIYVFHIQITLCVVKVWVVGPSELQGMMRSGCFGSTLQRAMQSRSDSADVASTLRRQ